MIDNLDIAYLAMGADAAWRKLLAMSTPNVLSSFDGYGQDGVIAEVIAFADNLTRAWDPLTWAGGVWYYDVSEPLGEWIVSEWQRTAVRPTSAQVDAQIAFLMTQAQGK